MSRTISTSLRLEIVEVYYHSNMKKTDICKKYGISKCTLYRIISTFAPIKSIKQSMSEESNRANSSSLNSTEDELLLSFLPLIEGGNTFKQSTGTPFLHIKLRSRTEQIRNTSGVCCAQGEVNY